MVEEAPIFEDKGANTVLCSLNEMEDPGSKGFRVGRREPMFIIREDKNVFGYVNLCPHQGTTLDWKPDAFLTVEKDYILCATHGAIFKIDSGVCVWGPCKGRRLAAVNLRIEDGNVFLNE